MLRRGQGLPAPEGTSILQGKPKQNAMLLQRRGEEDAKGSRELQSCLSADCPAAGQRRSPAAPYSVRSSGSRSAACPSSKARSVNSREWYSPRLTAHERSAPLRTRHSLTLSRPHDTILSRERPREDRGRTPQAAGERPVPQGPPADSEDREQERQLDGCSTTTPPTAMPEPMLLIDFLCTLPGVIKKSNLQGLDVHICVRFGQHGHLSTTGHLSSVPHHHHLKQENMMAELLKCGSLGRKSFSSQQLGTKYRQQI